MSKGINIQLKSYPAEEPNFERRNHFFSVFQMYNNIILYFRFQNFLSRIGRRKEAKKSEDVLQTRLKRCLSTLDITLLGIGHMMGSGIYVISPEVAKKAGPACVVSYVIAGKQLLMAIHVNLRAYERRLQVLPLEL